MKNTTTTPPRSLSAASNPPAFAPNPAPPPEDLVNAFTNEKLLEHYLDERMTIADIAFNIGRTIAETLEALRSPGFLTLAENYAATQARRAAFVARCALETAARSYIRLAKTCDKPETTLRAAGAIVRMSASNDPRPASMDMRIRAAATLVNARPDVNKEALERLAHLIDADIGTDARPASASASTPPPPVSTLSSRTASDAASLRRRNGAARAAA